MANRLWLVVNSSILIVLIPHLTLAATKPNIIFIMADDMGYADAGCYGGKLIRTPNIDRLAQHGTRFTDCYAGSPVCAPSRSVLMTGKHTGHTTVRGNFGVGGVTGLAGGKGRVPLRAEDVTVAEVLQKAGYATGMTGKWGLGEPNTTGEPNRQGFDEWFGFLNQRRAHKHYPTFLWLNRGRFDLPGNDDGKRQQFSHDLFSGFAMSFIRSNKHKPFFLYVPYTVPHSDFEAPELGEYEAKSWSSQEKFYAAMITRMDDHIGRIMKLLSELKLDKNTVVFFCSDNGAADRYDNLFKSSGPLRGRKRDMFEGGLRTPMVVRWPGRVAAGGVSDAPWYFADFLPTAAAIAGVDHQVDDIDGVSVLPTLLGKPQPELRDRFMYWEFFEGGYRQAVRWKHWKAIRQKVGAPLELYDLNADVAETTNVALQNSGIVAAIDEHLKTARTESAEWPIAK